jgi:hypothetical protein
MDTGKKGSLAEQSSSYPNNSALSGDISEKVKHGKGLDILTTSPSFAETCATEEVGMEKKTRGSSVTRGDAATHTGLCLSVGGGLSTVGNSTRVAVVMRILPSRNPQ